jgi:hypothetical protein
MPVMTSPLALAIEPILGKQIKLRAGDTWWCQKCRSVMVTITKAPPPHAARLDCSDCGRFRKWMGFNEAKAFIETTAIFGWPTTAAIQPLSPEFENMAASPGDDADISSTPPNTKDQHKELSLMSNSFEVAKITADDGFGVPEKASSSSIIGTMVKFTDGQFIEGKDKPLPIGTRLVAKATITAWVHWKDNKPVEHRITQTGQHHPDREELPDLDEAQWPPGLNGEPNDPWKDTRYLHLIDQQTGADYTFITDSIGGKRGVADLKNQIANVRSSHPGAVPVIALGSTPWKTKFGIRQRPQFHVVDWIGRDDHEDAPF